jgi:hypothetical protein
MTKKPRTTTPSVIAITSMLIASVVSVAIQFHQNALAQSSSNSNPLAKIPVIGKLVGGDKGGNATTSSGNATTNSSSAGNATSSNQSSSNPLAKIPVIGKLLGGK